MERQIAKFNLNSNVALTWEEVLRLIFSVVENDVMTSRVNESVIFEKIDIVLDFSVNTKDEPK